MRKIALPVKDNKLSPHFGEGSYFKFFYEENGIITKVETIPTPPQIPEQIPNWLADNGVTDVIAFGIGLIAIDILNRNKINVFVGVQEKEPEAILRKFLDGTLETDGNLCDH